MVFVIQNTQNRDTAAMHIKIDELIRVTHRARNVLLDLEELDDKTLELLRKDYERSSPARRSRGRGHRSAPRKCRRSPAAPSRGRGRPGDDRSEEGDFRCGTGEGQTEASQTLLQRRDHQG